jgi:hypothetical protein
MLIPNSLKWAKNVTEKSDRQKTIYANIDFFGFCTFSFDFYSNFFLGHFSVSFSTNLESAKISAFFNNPH